MYTSRGFTLIEMMVVISMVAILASIAVPSYRQYVLRNAESQAQVRMKQLDIELDQWRATALTYKGFHPKKIQTDGTTAYLYDATDNKTIYVPANSTASTYQYKITLVDGVNRSKSLVTTGNGVDLVTGRAWAMFAEPSSRFSDARKLMLNSQGLACKTRNNDTTISVLSADCGTYSEKW